MSMDKMVTFFKLPETKVAKKFATVFSDTFQVWNDGKYNNGRVSMSINAGYIWVDAPDPEHKDRSSVIFYFNELA